MYSINAYFKNNNYKKVIDLIEDKKKNNEPITQEENTIYIASILMLEDYEKLLKQLKLYYYIPFKKYDSPQEKIDKIEKYKKKNTLNYYILRNYYMALLSLGKYEEAYHYINACARIFQNMTSMLDLVLLYIRCNRLDEVNGLLEENKFKGNEYLEIGIAYILIGHYKEGEKYLELANQNELTFTQKQKYFLYKKKLEKNKIDNTFIEMRYEKFKEKYTISPGDVVYVRKTNRYYEEQDFKSQKRPYLIWKIEKDNIYAFPLSKKIFEDDKSYILYYQKYVNFDSDRKVKDNIVLLKEEDIEKVLERIDEFDLNCTLKNVYIRVMKSKKENYKLLSKPLIDFYQEKIKLNSGEIVFSKLNTNSYNYYLVLNNDNGLANLLEIDFNSDDIIINNNNPIQVDSHNIIYRKETNITENQQNQIRKVLNKYNHNKSQARFGDIIKIDDKLLLIISERNDSYICKDITIDTCNFEFQHVEIPKNTYYEIVERFSEENTQENIKKYSKNRRKL